VIIHLLLMNGIILMINKQLQQREKENEISNALMNAYDIKKNSYFKKIKDRILDEGISDSSEYTIGDCLDDLINSLEQLSD